MPITTRQPNPIQSEGVTSSAAHSDADANAPARNNTNASGTASTSTSTSKLAQTHHHSRPWATSSSAAFRELQAYGQSLLPHDNVTARPPPLGVDDADASLRELEEDADDFTNPNPNSDVNGRALERDGSVMRCREAVEVLTRNPKRSMWIIESTMTGCSGLMRL